MFYSYGISELTDTVENFVQKKVDSDRELLDFSRNKNKLEDSAGSDSELSRMNLNTAGIPELIKLPGIGNKTAEKILEYRKSHGSFKNVEELLNVKGIGQAKFRKIKQYLFID